MSLLHVNFGEEEPEEQPIKQNYDSLGSMLQGKWDSWSLSRREIEEEWLKDLRAFNQINEPDIEGLSKFHNHIYFGITRTKCLSSYSRIVDLMFQSSDKHWDITSTPVPQTMDGNPVVINAYVQEMMDRAERMEDMMDDQLIDLHYEDKLKAAVMEGCIIGTGVVKGIIPGVKTIDTWAMTPTGWDVIKSELPYPDMSHCSIFDIYVDPYATCYDDISGVFERHILNRNQLSALKDDAQFDSEVISGILKANQKGNHVSLSHETERRRIAGISDSSATLSERFDVLEYWGQVAGSMLVSAGLEVEDEAEMYWCNIWTCSGQTLLAKLMPMKKQRIPYNFFIYARVPHQFYGVGPARMMRHSQYALNGSVRSLLDNAAISSGAQYEVDVRMLKKGEDPNVIIPWKVWLRDAGDPDTPAVRFYQPDSKVGDLTTMIDLFRKHCDEETAIPSYTHGEQIPGLNKTASGMSMLMGAANVTIKSIVKNLEDFCIKPLLQSLFDWNMQWNDREDIKGDMNIDVRGSSALIAKEMQSQRLIQYLQLTANPVDLPFIDRAYLLREAANALDIDAGKAVPNPNDQYGQAPSTSPINPMLNAGMGNIPGVSSQPIGSDAQAVGGIQTGQAPITTGTMQ